MNELKIKVHSVVDVITNSSTVIYTQATEGTISAIKEMVNALLELGESKLRADDLFEFELYWEREVEGKMKLIYDNSEDFNAELKALEQPILDKYGALASYRSDFKGDKEEFKPIQKKYSEDISALQKKYTARYSENPPEWYDWKPDWEDESYSDIDLIVRTISDDENAKIAGKILGSLDSLFSQEATRNG